MKIIQNFQYPRSDRAGCNGCHPSTTGHPQHLSVSSVGSSGMQPSFLALASRSASTFSILGRIERDATNGHRCPRRLYTSFQYPRSDRAGCNAGCLAVRSPIDTLSVSSVGSSGMQPSPVDPGQAIPATFQYPRSDRAGCNWGYHSCFGAFYALSVSSVGSSGMQPDVRIVLASAFQTFSILGRIERDATHWSWPAGRNQQALSVSSVGSSGMQLVVLLMSRFISCSFSILGRIERDATTERAGPGSSSTRLSVSSVGSSGMQRNLAVSSYGSQVSFSILGRIERDATLFLYPCQQCSIPFQYPRSDRAGCNFCVSCRLSCRLSTFSILGRIERDATKDLGGGLFSVSRLSVSSVGSSGMQLVAGILANAPMALSVSSVGSSGMQLKWPRVVFRAESSFSILGRIERDATLKDRGSNRRRVAFQYPRSDRAGCNSPSACWPAAWWPSSFSILGRIERDATWVSPSDAASRPKLSVSSVGSSGMQPSSRSRMRSKEELSVSSVGSSGMQLW